jgi:transcriptional regulator with XRE-family HTH domain
MQARSDRARRAFVARLQEAKLESGLNQTEMAERVGVSQSTVSDWLNPEKLAMPGGNVLMRLVRVLDVSADWLLYGTGSRRGGPAPAGEAYHGGGLAAISEMRGALDDLESYWRGAVSPTAAAEDLKDERELDRAPRPAHRRGRRDRSA